MTQEYTIFTFLSIAKRYFSKAYINESGEVILNPDKNIYVGGKFETKIDFALKAVEWLSNQVANNSYNSKLTKEKYLEFMNKLICNELSYDQWDDIYRKYGNGIKHEEAVSFVKNGCDV